MGKSMGENKEVEDMRSFGKYYTGPQLTRTWDLYLEV